MKAGAQYSLLAQHVVQAIRSVVGTGPVALHEPNFSGNELLYLKECLDSTYVSSVGPFVDRFESDLAQFTGAKHVVAVVNGTAALHVALKLAGVQAGDEVLTPALTFVATANAVAYCGAVPHFVDSEVSTLGIDAGRLSDYLASHAEMRGGHCVNRSSGRIIRAIVPMHVFGHPSQMDQLLAVAHDHNLALVEDAAESIGSYYQGQHTGTFGKLGVLSFNGNKIMTTGGGGAILTDDAQLARHAKHLTTTAKLPHAWEFRHDEIGFNYRLPNINAALGCAQLERLPAMLSAKRELFHQYARAFASVPGVAMLVEPDGCRSNYWLQALVLDEEYAELRDEILQTTNAVGVMTRPAWTPLMELAPFHECPRMDLFIAESMARRLVNIPSSATLVTVAQ